MSSVNLSQSGEECSPLVHRTMTARPRWKRFAIVVPIVVAVGVCLWSPYQVQNRLTREDREVIPIYLAGIQPIGHDASYSRQLNFIHAVQLSVLRIAPLNVGLPFGTPREPLELLRAHQGLCYDRSRVIEKILRYSGFKTRHVAIYSTAETHSALLTVVTPGVDSHAVSEVLTKRGWLVLDSNTPWMAVDAQQQPLSMQKIQEAAAGSEGVHFGSPVPEEIFAKPFIFFYGLYSRNGRFYPPYNYIPDIQADEFLQNFCANSSHEWLHATCQGIRDL